MYMTFQSSSIEITDPYLTASFVGGARMPWEVMQGPAGYRERVHQCCFPLGEDSLRVSRSDFSFLQVSNSIQSLAWHSVLLGAELEQPGPA